MGFVGCGVSPRRKQMRETDNGAKVKEKEESGVGLGDDYHRKMIFQ